jgi:zinc protease
MTVRLTLLAALLLLFAPAVAQDAATEPWPFERSDVPVDPAFTFGTLPNGMRYVLRENHTPEGTVLVRLRIGSGSLEEREEERGLAHFLEHMAFNGSRRVPEGEMVKLLEREGLAFGADTNASTGFETTVYKLDLPRSDQALIDTALMLMRETASELTIDPAAVERERGVVLAERRDRTNFALKETLDQWDFLTPEARYPSRLPIGVPEVLTTASAQDIRGFYERAYVPANVTLVVVGAIDVAAVQAMVRERFGDWQAGPVPAPPAAGPVDLDRAGLTDIYVDPALSERVTISRHLAWQEETDTIAQRRTDLLRDIGYRIVNRRLETLSRAEQPPFRDAGFGTGDVFEEGRTTNLVIDAVEGRWREGLTAAAREWRRALAYGFSEAEVAEQVARIRTAQENAAAGAATRSNGALVSAIFAMLDDDMVPSTPESSLERFEQFAPHITPGAVLAALVADAAPLENPLIRYQGRTAAAGAADALRAAWDSAVAEDIAPLEATGATSFAYTDFGPPGAVVSDETDDRFGIRKLRFANGLRLNLKRTLLQRDRIQYELTLDGGSLLNTRTDPLATALVSSLPAGGLGRHSQDELETVLAGRSVQLAISAAGDAFEMRGTTTPRDLTLQMELLAAGITDPGYRSEGESRFRRNMANFFQSKDATPGRALGNALGGILSDGDPRFTLQPEAAYQQQTFAHLREVIGDRLAHGAIELALVGDFDEQAAIAAVAGTLGALPPRERAFKARQEARERSFTGDRTPRRVTHFGEPDQALLQLTWPTVDDSDQAEALRLELLERIVAIELQEELRERLGKAYSPSASSNPSRVWKDYGTFAVAASVDVADVAAARAAVREVMTALVSGPVSADVLDRARRPLLEAYDNALKTNSGWMGLVDRAQSESFRLDRFQRTRELLEAATPAALQLTAARYLAPDSAVEVLAVPAAAE